MATELLLDRHLFVLEPELLIWAKISKKTFPDLQQLLCNDRKHLDSDTVELIKTSPATYLGKTRKQSLHNDVVDLIGTVENDTESRYGFRKILSRFRLSSTGGACRVCTEFDVKGTSDSNPAPVGQRCNDKS